MVLGRLKQVRLLPANAVSMAEMMLLSCDHVCIKQPSDNYDNAHRFCNTQPTTFFRLLQIQLMITPMMPGNALLLSHLISLVVMPRLSICS